MANYFITTIEPTLAPPHADQARWQMVCENGITMVPEVETGYESGPFMLSDGYVHAGPGCNEECWQSNDKLVPDNLQAELVDILKLIS